MRSATRWVTVVLIAYGAGFLFFPRSALLIIDETSYVTQALAFSRGAIAFDGAQPVFPPTPYGAASNYPPGTSLAQAPFVAIAGWRGAAAASVVAVVIAVIVAMRWLRDAGWDPRFAALVTAFVPTLFFGRIAMSDAPCMAMAALGAWLLFRAERGWTWSLAAGFACGLTVLFRETNAVLLAPIAIGAMARRKCAPIALIAGVLGGVSVRLAFASLLFGDPFYVRSSGYGFSLASAQHNVATYALILLVIFPLGAVLPVLYRGPRRPELRIATACYVALFLLYDYGGLEENGGVRGLLLVSRYMLPLIPILAFMAAEVAPRLLGERARVSLGRLVPAALIALAVLAFAIHPAIRRQERSSASVVAAISAAVPEGTTVITNHHATLKYVSPVYGTRPLILRSYVTPSDVPAFARSRAPLGVVFIDRTDTDMFRRDADENARFLDALRQRCVLDPKYDSVLPQAGRLRIFNVTGCS